MNVEDLYNYCLSIPGAEATTPFDDVTLVMKVCGKMFALIPLDADLLSITIKCDPETAVSLREQYSCVSAAWHMNKTHWNSVECDGLKKDLIMKLIDSSYELIFSSFTKKMKEEILKS